jgi:tetratricopeptide (TPR) repeat protein
MPMAAQQWYFTIDEYRDAERDALRGVNRVLVVNNALVQPNDFGHSSVLDGNNKSNISVDLDRALLYSLFSLTRAMEESGALDAVELLDISQNHSTNYYSREAMSPVAVNNLLKTYDVDALLVLNQLVLYDVLEAFEGYDGAQYAYMQAFAQSHWSVYYADARRRGQVITHADTLVWEANKGYTRSQVLEQLPDRQEALLYLASTLGANMGKSLVPNWVSVNRYLYNHDDAHVQAGLEAFRRQRWEEAIGHWQLVMGSGVQEFRGLGDEAKGKENKAAAVAAANIAIAYELLGDYALACDYASEASRLFGALKTAWARQQQVNIRYYLEQLRAKKAREAAR